MPTRKMVRITNELMTLDELQEAGYLKGLETGDMIICKKSDFSLSFCSCL